ncbi:hypothetical protein OSB04_017835, partial [Centaurea solstitialis]
MANGEKCNFSVASLRKKLDSSLLQNDRNLKTNWIKGIIPEVKVCPLCTLAPETEDHLMMDCPFSQRLLNEIGSWWSLNIPVGPIESLLIGVKIPTLKELNLKNEVVHGGDKFSIQKSLSLLQGLPYFWLYHRGNCKSKITCLSWLSWLCWRRFPHLIFPLLLPPKDGSSADKARKYSGRSRKLNLHCSCREGDGSRREREARAAKLDFSHSEASRRLGFGSLSVSLREAAVSRTRNGSDGLTSSLTVPSGRYDTWTFQHYITHDQVGFRIERRRLCTRNVLVNVVKEMLEKGQFGLGL